MADRAAPPCALIVMGVSGSGKSTIAERLAAKLGWTFKDGDAFHPAANVEKMSKGHALTDQDRQPWLQAIADAIDCSLASGDHLIVACSALKRSYRDILVHGRHDVRIVFLDGGRDLIAKRLAGRKGHFMPQSLLESQFSTLERPGLDERPLVVCVESSIDKVVDAIVDQLRPSASK